MTVLSALVKPETRAVQATAWGDWGTSSTSWAGKTVDTTTALQLLTVYGCNRFICDGISTLPVDVLRREADGSSTPLNTPPLLRMPTVDLDFTGWATQALSSLLLAGNFYGFRLYADGRLTQVVPLDPEKVTVQRQQGRKVYLIEGRVYTSADVLHIPGVMWPGSDVGLSPLEAARQTIGKGLAVEEYAAKFFGQGASLAGVIETPAEMTPDNARKMARTWDSTHAGSDKSHKTGVLVGGAQWKPTAVNNEQAQFLETQQFTASQIASLMFQIDPSEMGLPVDGSSLTYANLEQRNARKVQVTFLPWIIRLEAALTALLPRPQFVKLNVNGLLRGDTTNRFAAYATAIQNDFLTPNEAREFEDWPPLPGGDDIPNEPTPSGG